MKIFLSLILMKSAKNASFLIIGNPPVITNTELSKINSNNLPDKQNLKNKLAIDALTGSSNFDISESIIMKMIDEFKNTQSTIAFLCKTTVSRNIFKELIRNKIDYSFTKQINFNSRKIFKIDADACLFIVQFGGSALKDMKCPVSDISNPSKVLFEFGFQSGEFYSDLSNIADIDGECMFEWRQGVKHDLAKIMELEKVNNHFVNKNGAEIALEDKFIYPLLKSSDLKKAILTKSRKYVIITQKKIKNDTTIIKSEAPKIWDYLNKNKELFKNRKSKIYKNSPDFSIFGIGDYSFKKYKVAISGFYKDPKFCLVYSQKSMMLDDTCYFISFDDYDTAYITMLILNTSLVKKFLKSIVFIDSKRPYAKKVLKRIDITKCLKILTLNDLTKVEQELNLNKYIDNIKFDTYKKHIKINIDLIKLTINNSIGNISNYNKY